MSENKLSKIVQHSKDIGLEQYGVGGHMWLCDQVLTQSMVWDEMLEALKESNKAIHELTNNTSTICPALDQTADAIAKAEGE